MSKSVIAYLCVSNSWGGLEMNQLRNAQWMQERGHKVLLLGLKESRIIRESKEHNIKTLNVEQHRKYYDVNKAKKLSKLLKKNGVTHLVIRDPKDISLSVTAKRLMRNKLHLSYFMEMQLGVKKTDIIHTFRFRGLDLWSCPLGFLANQVNELTNYDPGKIRIIPSGMDLSKFENLPSSTEAREKLNLSPDKLLIGLIGRLDPFKGQMLVLDAYESMPKELKEKVEIVFLGDKMNPDIDDFYNRLTNRVKEPVLNGSVTILPFRKDVELFYAAMDATIMASKAETFGMVTIESMACGKPVIGSNAGGTPELIGENERGILFQTMDKNSLCQAISSFVNDYSFDANKLKKYTQKYSHHKVCEMVEKELGL
jgi:glycosyltransferase involved in cell wall biosynthesis